MESYKRLSSETKEIKVINIDGIEEIKTQVINYIQRQSDLAIIPCVEGNSDYAQYLLDIENGVEITDFDYEVENLRQSEAERLNGYKRERQKEYLSIGDQLDMIYWDKINGTNLWQEHITEIKTKYPKP